ncbi:MAG TPA: RcnB family protein [Sphingomicrobium sp.]|nr:RcnB family protein [Sphingomicrobium sp.]
MRSLAIFLLFAGASVPALSQDRDRSGDERPMRAERSDRADRPNRAERMEARSQAREAAREQRATRVERQSAAQQSVAQQSVSQQSVETNAEAGVSERRPSAFGRQRQGYDIAPRQREVRTIPNVSPAPVVTERSRDGVTTQHRSRDGRRWSGDHRRWDRDSWRHDRRYDWRRYRDRNRSIFRLGIYLDPFGWGYNRWGIGSRLYPNYYRSSYWINDPWMYRLPHAYPPYRWVRYHNDALLVDTWSGEVVDVIYNFFW